MKSIKKMFSDGVASLTSGLANRRNAHSSNVIHSHKTSAEELRAIYKSGIGSKIIRLKSGIALNDTLQFETEADKDFYETHLQSVTKDACKFMLAFGRSLVVMHETGADLSQPMPRNVDKKKIRMHNFSGDMVYVSSVNFDLSSLDYLQPTSYSVRGFSIHPSRVVDFRYVKPCEMDAPEYAFGGISEFELIRNELVSDAVVQRAVPAMLEKSSTMFYKIQGFKELLADNQEQGLLNYFSSLEDLRSIYGAGIIDQEDSVESVSQSLANLAESDSITLRRLAMVTGLPLTWLVGEAARGLNATGDGERQILMQTIQSLQSEYLLEPINRMMAMFGRGRVWFKDNQGESPTERVAYESEVIKNAVLLWQMGEDYTKYLQDRDVTSVNTFEQMFGMQEDEDAPAPPPFVFGGDE